jgi:hypothetical protein
VKQDEHWVRDVAGWAYIFLAMVVVVLAVSWLFS